MGFANRRQIYTVRKQTNKKLKTNTLKLKSKENFSKIKN